MRRVWLLLGIALLNLTAFAQQPITPHYVINEVELKAGDNPAYALIEQVIQSRDRHQLGNYPAYSLTTYNKFILDAEVPAELQSPYLFITESVTKTEHIPGKINRQTVEASRISGLKKAEFAVLANNLQSTDFYSDFIELYARNYLNPISPNSRFRYYFAITDTLFTESADTLIEVYFTPRSAVDFRALTGTLRIHRADRALSAIEAVTSDSGRVRFSQDFQRVSGRWFPRHAHTTIALSSIQVNDSSIYGRGQTTVSEIVFLENSVREDRPAWQADVTFAPTAMRTPDSLWARIRPQPLDSSEIRTYAAIDSLGEAEKLDQKFFFFSALRSGRINVGQVSLGLEDFLGYNRREGFRLGFSAETRRSFHPRWVMEGRAVYGFSDETIKGGAALGYRLRPDLEWVLQVGYFQEAVETGGTRWLLPSRADRQAFLRDLMVLRQDLQQCYFVRFSGYFNPRWRWAVEASHFSSTPRFDDSRGTRAYTALTSEVHWQPGASAMQTQYGWVQLDPSPSPVQFQVQFGASDSLYLRSVFRASHRMNYRSGAFTVFRASGGWAINPLTPLQQLNLAGNRGNVVQSELAMQTLWAHERVASAALQAGVSHAFRQPFARWRAYPVFHVQALVDDTNLPPYFEAGWSVERIFSRLGVGVMMGRSLEPSPEDWRIAVGMRVLW